MWLAAAEVGLSFQGANKEWIDVMEGYRGLTLGERSLLCGIPFVAILNICVS